MVVVAVVVLLPVLLLVAVVVVVAAFYTHFRAYEIVLDFECRPPPENKNRSPIPLNFSPLLLPYLST